MEAESSKNGISEEDVEIVCDEVKENKTDVVQPIVGMKFDDLDEMYDFFRDYSKVLGFSVRRRHSKKGDDGEVRYVTFECARGGKVNINKCTNPLKPKPQGGTQCKARLSACLGIDKKWRIGVVVLDHIHDLSPTKS
ncbi:FAR1 DNA binding domain [Macleaya cordata]|uniref:FAR1 DNA binding domain n=1 Tax=Macleaya cordata TaxID=56857 RepID=A0A200Q7P1_MACCD|nr:FAR1 DNA binding domain [Macleaya cordata]